MQTLQTVEAWSSGWSNSTVVPPARGSRAFEREQSFRKKNNEAFEREQSPREGAEPDTFCQACKAKIVASIKSQSLRCNRGVGHSGDDRKADWTGLF